MSLIFYEGTADYEAATPVLVTTFEASGSIAAGKMVLFMGAADQRVYQGIAGTHSAASIPAGLALATVANADPCPVLVWGYAKNISVSALQTNLTGYGVVSGAGYLHNSGSIVKNVYSIAKIISGSATTCTAFINCMG